MSAAYRFCLLCLLIFVILFVQESGEFFQGGGLPTHARDQHEAREGPLACWQGMVMKNRGELI